MQLIYSSERGSRCIKLSYKWSWNIPWMLSLIPWWFVMDYILQHSTSGRQCKRHAYTGQTKNYCFRVKHDTTQLCSKRYILLPVRSETMLSDWSWGFDYQSPVHSFSIRGVFLIFFYRSVYYLLWITLLPESRYDLATSANSKRGIS